MAARKSCAKRRWGQARSRARGCQDLLGACRIAEALRILVRFDRKRPEDADLGLHGDRTFRELRRLRGEISRVPAATETPDCACTVDDPAILGAIRCRKL